MDFCHLIVTCLFSMRRLPFDNQKVKGNYAILNIKRKHLFFDFKIKAKYLAFISCLLEKPDLSVKTALKSIFRKSQVRTISEKFGLNLNAQIVCLSPSQWLNCFLEMLEVVPEKFHPS